RTTPRRMLALAAGMMHELVEDSGGAWSDVAVYTYAELGATTFGYELYMTPDGLRFIDSGTVPGGTSEQVLYADRPSLDVPFSHVVPVQDVDFLPGAFLTEDCGRLYFSSFGSVFYVPRD